MKKQIYFIFLLVVLIGCQNKKIENNQIEQINSEVPKNVFSKEFYDILYNSYDRSWPLYLVVFSKENENYFIYVIGTLMYSKELIGYHRLNDIIYALYVDDCCVSFANKLVNLRLLNVDYLGPCNYENRSNCPIPAFEEEYLKFFYNQGGFELVEQGRVESIKTGREVPRIFQIIKERLEVPLPPEK